MSDEMFTDGRLNESFSKALDFMRDWFALRFGVNLSLAASHVRSDSHSYWDVKIEVEGFGKQNTLFSEFIDKATCCYRIYKSKESSTQIIYSIGAVRIQFHFKNGGSNGWEHSDTFVYFNKSWMYYTGN